MEVVALALAIDALVGDPDTLWRRLPHPVAWFGRAIAALERVANRGKLRRAKGALVLLAVVVAFALPAAALAGLLVTLPGPASLACEAALASVLLAHNSLHRHVARVRAGQDLQQARAAVAMIVGRDVAALDDAGISRASLETLAESLSDGVVAPAFWLAVGGLPGLVAYKVVNTADSMIGHRDARYRAFGCAAARADDLMNLVPARLTALLIAIAAPLSPRRWPGAARDAAGHVSPNGGWPEAALAHALGIALGGPRAYAGRRVDGAWFNPKGRAARLADLSPALALSRRVGLLHALGYAALALALA